MALVVWAPASLATAPAPSEQVAEAVRKVRVGLGFSALAASPLLRDEAEGEVLRAFLAGLTAALEGGAVVPERYARLHAAGLAIGLRFPEASYRLQVEPGDDLPTLTLPLRRHPWSVLHGVPLPGWRAQAIGGGLRLRPVSGRAAPAEPTACFR
ncbi:MAG: hypothetical protein VKQ33_08975 [Candidatus Sericytochromatia bacterium]|nr:hypothetical protein [Candidatus Sericytochromatia bacterium]